MIKLVAFDLDGTLAESKLPMKMEMAKLLQELARHVKVVVISGGSIKQFEKQLLYTWNGSSTTYENNSNLILLPVDGTECFEYDQDGKWKIVDKDVFDPILKQKAIDELNKIILKGGFDIPSNEERVGEYIEDRETEVNFSAYGQQGPLDKKALWDPDQKKRIKIKQELDKLLGDEFEISIAGTTSIDILPKGRTKASGLLRLVSRLKIDPKHMVFVGDAVFKGGNDYSPKEAGIKTMRVTGPEATEVLIKNFIKTIELIK